MKCAKEKSGKASEEQKSSKHAWCWFVNWFVRAICSHRYHLRLRFWAIIELNTIFRLNRLSCWCHLTLIFSRHMYSFYFFSKTSIPIQTRATLLLCYKNSIVPLCMEKQFTPHCVAETFEYPKNAKKKQCSRSI